MFLAEPNLTLSTENVHTILCDHEGEKEHLTLIQKLMILKT
jgi:hypothetical protein